MSFRPMFSCNLVQPFVYYLGVLSTIMIPILREMCNLELSSFFLPQGQWPHSYHKHRQLDQHKIFKGFQSFGYGWSASPKKSIGSCMAKARSDASPSFEFMRVLHKLATLIGHLYLGGVWLGKNGTQQDTCLRVIGLRVQYLSIILDSITNMSTVWFQYGPWFFFIVDLLLYHQIHCINSIDQSKKILK